MFNVVYFDKTDSYYNSMYGFGPYLFLFSIMNKFDKILYFNLAMAYRPYLAMAHKGTRRIP